MEVTLYSPHSNQKLIHEAINETDTKYFVLDIGRQFGKSILGQNQCVDFMLNKGWSGAWVSPTYRQAKKVSDEMDSAFKGLFNYNRSELIMRTPNGSQLQMFSSERYDNIRGFTFDFLIMDEAAWQDEEAWTSVLRPTILVKGKKVLFLSTPRGKNWFYTLFQLGLTEDNYKSFRFTSYDNPMIDPKEIDSAKQVLPDHIFRQEYLAEFIDDAGSVFRNIPESIRLGDKSGRLFAGVDLGRADDYTVLTIINEKNDEVFCKRWRHMDWSTIINEVSLVLNEYKPRVRIESNGAQDAIYEMILKKITYNKSFVEPFVTTSKSKQTIIEDLIVCFEEKSIGIIGEDFQRHELEIFTYEYNLKTRSIKYSAPIGLHDDYVMSRAIAYNCLKETKGKSNFIFKQIS